MELSLVNFAFGALGTGAGFAIKHWLEKRSEAESRRFEDRRKHFENLLLASKNFAEGEERHADLFWFEYSFIWLSASEPVIHGANAVVAILEKLPREITELNLALGQLVAKMRRDLGLGTSGVAASDYLAASPPSVASTDKAHSN